MYTTLWKKYLPVIRIVLKRSLKEDQTLDLNVPDFERAGLKRKATLSFVLKLKNGKPGNVIIDVPLASSLASVLTTDAATQQILASNEFHFSLNTKCQLSIKHIASTEVEPAENIAAEVAETA